MFLKIFAVVLLFSANWPDSISDHAFYVSVVEIKHSANSSIAELTVKVFTDDLQDALRNTLNSEVPIDAQEICSAHHEDVAKYFSSHISLYLNDDLIPVILDGCEEIGDTFQLHFTMDCPKNWNELKIFADFLMELFPTQSQMVYVTHNDDSATLRLTSKSKSQTITFTR